MPSRVPREIEDAMIAAYLDGATQEEVAAQFGYSRDTCIHVLQRRGIKARSISEAMTASDKRRMPKELEDAMVAAYLAGATLEQAAGQFGYSTTACQTALRRRGITPRTLSEASRMPYEHEDTIIELYLAGATLEEAAAQFGYTPRTVINVLKRRGITRRSRSEAQRRYAVDESFFDNIDTEDKAYWLGFLTADGLITDHVVRINLQLRDIDHLYKFTASLRSEQTVTFRDTIASNGIVTKQAVIIISSRRLVRALNRLGLTSNKTFTVRPCEAVPEELLADYWRGVFDGDGSISSSGLLGITWKMSLVGNKFMVEGFHDFIASFVNTKANVRPFKNVFTISYSGRMVTRAVAQVLYENATIYLDRKYDRAKKLCGRDL